MYLCIPRSADVSRRGLEIVCVVYCNTTAACREEGLRLGTVSAVWFRDQVIQPVDRIIGTNIGACAGFQGFHHLARACTGLDSLQRLGTSSFFCVCRYLCTIRSWYEPEQIETRREPVELHHGVKVTLQAFVLHSERLRPRLTWQELINALCRLYAALFAYGAFS